tara:strand:- start:615 stop:1037 length:423 start_codon:yes stop_codon:yes gene_type:complete
MIAEALMCMALNIYHEAKNQSMLGQIAVGQVVMNRVEDRRFPNTVCEVVKQAVTYKGTDVPVLHKCHFSWYCDGKDDTPNFDSKSWTRAKEYAHIVLSKKIIIDVTEGATHYHATYVRPAWAKTKRKTTRIDRHIFYRWE